MKLYTQLQDIRQLYPNIVVALGTFDGIHYAHKQIIAQAAQKAREINGTGAVLTFSNHPLAVINPSHCPPQIITQKIKAQLIEQLGIDVLLNIPFTPEFLKWSPQYFIAKLVEYLNPRCIVVGPNYSYGYKGTGTPKTLLEAGEKFGFEVDIFHTITLDGKVVSSTNIRKLIAAGKISEASHLLGRPVSFEGKVVRGDGRGHTLGYPTANIAIAPALVLPRNGVYAVHLTIQGDIWEGIANVGIIPTFPQDRNKRIEVYIFGFEGNLYGQNVTVTFLSHIRDERKFSSASELKKQIVHDIQSACQNRTR